MPRALEPRPSLRPGRRRRHASPRERLRDLALGLWFRLDIPPVGRRVKGTMPVFFVGTLVTAAASVYTVHTGLNFAYTDAMAHLTIARRVIDSPSPGVQQLGTVWLPFPHLLLLPLVQVMFLWRTGIAACIVGALCMGSASASMYRVLARVGVDGIGRVAALLVFWANPSLVYVSTTALTEPVLIAMLMACMSGLIGWSTSPRMLSGGELAVFAGLPAAAAVLTRYEGWALTLSGSIYIAIFCWRRRLPWRRWVAYLASFTAPPAAAVLAWISYNYAMYGNPLDFMDGPYSAATFNLGFRYQGILQTAGNLGLTVEVYGESLWEIAGLLGLVLAAAGLVVMTLRWGFDQRALMIWLAGTSSAFLVYSLWAGQHVIMNDASLPPGDFNNRQSLSAMPWIAMLAGVLIGTWPRTRPIRRVAGLALAGVVAGLVVQNVWWSRDYYHRNSVIAEAINGVNAEVDRTNASRWLAKHYDGGGLLLDETSIASAPEIGVPLKDYYNRDNGAHFEQALADPARYVRWIVMHRQIEKYDGDTHDNDQVTAAMEKVPQFSAEYTIVYQSGSIQVLRRIDDEDAL